MHARFCDCGCTTCQDQAEKHGACPFECEHREPPPPDPRRRIGGQAGREVIAIE